MTSAILGVMRWLVLLLATACGRVGFDAPVDANTDAMNARGCPSGVTYCDDFQRTTPMRPNDPVWAMDACSDPGESLTVDDALVVSYPAYPGNYVQCQLLSRNTAPARTVDLAFDITFSSANASDDAVTLAIAGTTLATPNAAGMEWVQLQLDIVGSGAGGVTVVFYYPDASQSPDGTNFPAYDLVDSFGAAWLPPGVPCHVEITGDLSIPSANGMSTCAGVTMALSPHDTSPVAGIPSAPASIVLGYGNSGAPTQGGVVRYGNMTFTATP